MLLLRTVAPWLLLVCLGQQVSLSSGGRSNNRGGDKSVNPAPGKAQRVGKSAATDHQTFTIQHKIQCAWTSGDASDAVKLSITCKKRRTLVHNCQYVAKPQSCPQYLSDPKGFWIQVGRALQKMEGKVCTDRRALVRTRMCKLAPRDAHFKLDTVSSVTSIESRDPTTSPPASHRSSTSSAPTACTGRADHRKTAEEYCSGSWASVCSFLFSMVQSDC